AATFVFRRRQTDMVGPYKSFGVIGDPHFDLLAKTTGLNLNRLIVGAGVNNCIIASLDERQFAAHYQRFGAAMLGQKTAYRLRRSWHGRKITSQREPYNVVTRGVSGLRHQL